MIKLHDEFKKNGFVVLAIDLREKRKIVKKFVEKQKMPFPVLLDKDGKVSNKYGIRGVPAHFIINRHGEVIGMANGARGWESIESRNLIRFLVAQKNKVNNRSPIPPGSENNSIILIERKSRVPQIHGGKGEAVPLWRDFEPLTTQVEDPVSTGRWGIPGLSATGGLSRRVNKLFTINWFNLCTLMPLRKRL